MDLFEYQGKQFFAKYGIPVSDGAATDNVNRIDQMKDRVACMPRLTDKITREPSVRTHATQLLLPLSEECRLTENQDTIEALSFSTGELAQERHDRQRLVRFPKPHFIRQHHALALVDKQICEHAPYSTLLCFVPRAETEASTNVANCFFSKRHYFCSPSPASWLTTVSR